MHFTSINFLLFAISLGLSFGVIRGHIGRQWVLLIASYIFYAAWDWRFLGLIWGLTLIGWTGGYALSKEMPQKVRLRILQIFVLISLSILFFFKYASFIYTSLMEVFVEENPKPLNILLPIAISFTVFEIISYLVDVYRRQISHEASIRKFSLFIAFFPRLVAGPIIRPAEFLPQLDKPILLNSANICAGVQVFIKGALLKLVVADTLASYVDEVFREPVLYSSSTLWMAAVSYSVQIFCDFNGYSLMAIGLAMGIGIRMPENFKMPYTSSSLTEFWRRWHISLSTWLRDYLYIPLGGGRGGVAKTVRNLLITMSLGGLWHGASWNFLIWGVLHGIILSLEKLWGLFPISKRNIFPNFRALGIFLTFLIVTLLWIPFRSPDFETTVQFLQNMFIPRDGIQWAHPQSLIILIVCAIWHSLYVMKPDVLRMLSPDSPGSFKNFAWVTITVALICIFSAQNQSTFIYFQF